jgi:xanthine dehydrogenase YagS FAD-binding subunit
MYKFTHVNATSVADAASTLAKGKAQVIAGGTDLMCYLRGMFTLNPPTTIVNIKTIPNLAYIKEEGGMLKVGANTTLTAVATDATVKSKYTVLAEAARKVGSLELRNAGTIGGNICQKPRCRYYRADYNNFSCMRKNPSGICFALAGVNDEHSIFGAVAGCVAVTPSDIAPALVALNAKIITNKKAAGWAAADFFAPKGEQINAIDADEIVTEIQVPTPAAGTKSTYLKFAFRKSIDFPLVSAAVVATSAGGNVSDAVIVLGGVHGSPRKATAAETSIKGKAIDNTSAEAAGTAAVTGSVALAKNKYKIQIAKTLVKRALLAVK